MAYVVAIANLKGGSGKSCIAVNLACELANKAAVVLVDADEQGTAARYCSSGLLPVTCEHLPLVGDARATDRWASRVLAIAADYVVLDAPPHVGAATKAIIGIADLVVVPVSASPADLWATIPAVQLVRTVRASRAKGPGCLLVPSRVDSRTTAGREIEEALQKLGEPVGPIVHQRAAFVDALTVGKWIGDYAAHSDAHQDIAALGKRVERIRSHGQKAESKSR